MPVLKPTHELACEPVLSDWVPIYCGAVVLAELAQAVRDSVVTHTLKAAAGSPCYADAQVDETTAADLSCRVSELVQFACDQAMAVAALVKYPPHRFAPYTCARAVLEAGAEISWLCDSDESDD